MAAQKEEMGASFAAQKKELEEEYQQQADEMYFFGYRCCMKKNEIMHDTPSFPSDEEDEAPGGPSSWDFFFVQTLHFFFVLLHMGRLFVKTLCYLSYKHITFLLSHFFLLFISFHW